MKKLFIVAFLLVVVVLLAYELLVQIDNNFRSGRMRETPVVKPHEEELHLTEKGLVPFDGGEAIFRATKGEELRSPIHEGGPDSIKSGKILYATYCAQCHGKYHDGNGTVGQSFYPLPTDLRSQEVQASPEGVLFKSISYGVPNGRQPPLATTISVPDRWRILAYVKSLGQR